MLAAAREQLGEGGIESLTMRAVAQRLDVAPNALYSHVASKTALVDDLLDDVLGAVEEPSAGTLPGTGLQELMASTYRVLLAHPALVPLYLARQGARGPSAQRLGETMSRLFADAGLDEAPAREALRVLIVYTIGFAAFATRPPVETRGDGPLAAQDLQGNFISGLRWLLAGILET